MKNTTTAKKLTLNKETIRNLSDEKLGQVAGGDGDTGVGICGSVVCSILLACSGLICAGGGK